MPPQQTHGAGAPTCDAGTQSVSCTPELCSALCEGSPLHEVPGRPHCAAVRRARARGGQAGGQLWVQALCHAGSCWIPVGLCSVHPARPVPQGGSTHACWKHRMLSRMLNCCHRLEKFTFPSI